MTSVTDVNKIFSLDLRSLALYRVLLGAILILDTINRITLVPAFYSDSGIVPRSMVNLEQYEHAYHFQIFFVSGQEWLSYALLSILIIFTLFLLIGYKSRVSTIAIWLIFCSIIVRDGSTSNSGDILLIVLLFWSLFLPLGDAFSIDSLERSGFKKDTNHLSAASVGMYIQFVLLYITTGIHKAQYPTWLDGSHLYYTFSRLEFVDPAAFWIYDNYALLEILTHVTLIIELFGPLLFFIPVYFFVFRMAGLLLFLGLQISIILFMDVGMFSYVSIAGVLIFIPTQFWELNSIQNLLGKNEPIYQNLRDKIKQYFQGSVTETKRISSLSSSRVKVIKNCVLSLFIVYVCMWNIDDISTKFDMSDQLKKIGYYLKLDQSWKMFSGPGYTSEYYTVDAFFKDERKKNLIADMQKRYKTPDGFEHVVFKYNRWRKFFEREIKYEEREALFSEKAVEYFVSKKLDEKSIDNLRKVDLVEHSRVTGRNYDHLSFYGEVIFTKEY